MNIINQQPEMQVPVLAIVGRPNVGKSSLFNALTKSRQALVWDWPGVTRDRLYGQGQHGDKPYILIDTGGLEGENSEFGAAVQWQAGHALEEAHSILWVVSAREGLLAQDSSIADMLRKWGKPVLLVVNQIDGCNAAMVLSEFSALGFPMCAVSAAHRQGLSPLLSHALEPYAAAQVALLEKAEKSLVVAVVGRPNVGKSTLVNSILGETRLVVSEKAGTTLDSIRVPCSYQGQAFELIDTAGMRRRGRISNRLEQLSVAKSLQAVAMATVVWVVLDADAGISEQDLDLLHYVVQAGKGLLVVCNKDDALNLDKRRALQTDIDRRLGFVSFAPRYQISGLKQKGLGPLLKGTFKVFESGQLQASAKQLTNWLQEALAQHSLPRQGIFRIKMRYAHVGGNYPPKIVIHGTQTEKVPQSYVKFLQGFFAKKMRLLGYLLNIVFKNSHNPYQG